MRGTGRGTAFAGVVACLVFAAGCGSGTSNEVADVTATPTEVPAESADVQAGSQPPTITPRTAAPTATPRASTAPVAVPTSTPTLWPRPSPAGTTTALPSSTATPAPSAAPRATAAPTERAIPAPTSRPWIGSGLDLQAVCGVGLLERSAWDGRAVRGYLTRQPAGGVEIVIDETEHLIIAEEPGRWLWEVGLDVTTTTTFRMWVAQGEDGSGPSSVAATLVVDPDTCPAGASAAIGLECPGDISATMVDAEGVGIVALRYYGPEQNDRGVDPATDRLLAYGEVRSDGSLTLRAGNDGSWLDRGRYVLVSEAGSILATTVVDDSCYPVFTGSASAFVDCNGVRWEFTNTSVWPAQFSVDWRGERTSETRLRLAEGVVVAPGETVTGSADMSAVRDLTPGRVSVGGGVPLARGSARAEAATGDADLSGCTVVADLTVPDGLPPYMVTITNTMTEPIDVLVAIAQTEVDEYLTEQQQARVEPGESVTLPAARAAAVGVYGRRVDGIWIELFYQLYL